MTPDTDKREWLGEWMYAIFVQNYEKLLEENKNLKEELKQLEERYDRNAELYKRLLEENRKLKNYINLIEWTVRFKEI